MSKRIIIFKFLRYAILLAVIPTVILLGVILFNDRKYNIISMMVAVLACVPFFLLYERKKSSARELILISVMVAISSVGRFIFAAMPGFKPVTAVIIITAMHFGPEAGFLTGALSAIVSNIYFGQGPWTPFQMFTWGFIGLLAGLLNKKGLLNNRIGLITAGTLSGVLFSMMMDIWVVFDAAGNFNLALYGTKIISALPFTAIYAVSNVVFLLVMNKPVGRILARIKKKYRIGS